MRVGEYYQISFLISFKHFADAPICGVQAGYVVGEMTDPSRDLPRVIHTAMSVAISGFVLVNIALFTVIPFEKMRERSFVAVVGVMIIPRHPWEALVLMLTYQPGIWSPSFRSSRRDVLFSSRFSILSGSSECHGFHIGETSRRRESESLPPKAIQQRSLFRERRRAGLYEEGVARTADSSVHRYLVVCQENGKTALGQQGAHVSQIKVLLLIQDELILQISDDDERIYCYSLHTCRNF